MSEQTGRASESEPAPRQPPRLGKGVRDLVLSLVVLGSAVGLLAWIVGDSEFSPGGPSVDAGALPQVQVSEELATMAHGVDFPLRDPELDDVAATAGWQATSANMSTAAAAQGAPQGSPLERSPIARVGWVTDGERYVRLSQSQAPAEHLVADESERDPASLSAIGTVTAADEQWQVYPARDEERAWVTSLDDVQVMVTGSGTEHEFRALAEAITEAEPVQATDPARE